MRIDQLVHLYGRNIYDADINQNGKVTYIVGHQGNTSVIASNEELISWSSVDAPHVRHVRWAAEKEVVIWSIFDKMNYENSVKLLSSGTSRTLSLGVPRDIVFVGNSILSGYGEDQYILQEYGNIGSQLIAVFDNRENFLWGLQEFLGRGNSIDPPIDFQAGCADNQGNAIFVLYPSEGLWRITPDTKTIDRIAVPFSMSKVAAISAHDNLVYFSIRNDEGFLIVSFETILNSFREIGMIRYTELLSCADGDSYPRKLIQIHGCADGSMVISALRSVWQVRF